MSYDPHLNGHSRAIIIGELCPYCNKHRPHGDMLHFGDGGRLKRCRSCEEKHLIALEALAGKPPTECGECQVTFEQLAERTRGAEVSMFMHEKDGCYQVLCRDCSERHIAKRRELYKGTEFGHNRKL